MPTLTAMCGMETQTPAAYGTVTGTVTADTAVKRTGAASLKVAANSSHLEVLVPAAQNYGVVSFYLYVDALPTSDAVIVVFRAGGANDGCTLTLKSTGVLNVKSYGSAPGSQDGATLSTGTWTRIDLKNNTFDSVSDIRVDWWVNGTAQTSYTYTAGATTQSIGTGVRFGRINTPTGTFAVYFDDIVIASALADAPLGQYKVTGHAPDGAGTHGGTTTDYSKTDDSGTNWETLANPETTAQAPSSYTLVDNWPVVTAERVRRSTGTATTSYAEWTMADTAESTGPHGVMLFAAIADASNGVNNAQLKLNLSGTDAANAISVNPTTSVAYYRSSVNPNAPGQTGWTVTQFNDTRIRFTSSDSTPNPWLYAVLAEAAFPVAGTSPVTESLAVTYAVTGRISEPLAASYTARAQVAEQLAASWATRVQVAEALAASWVTRSQVAEQLTAAYQVTGRITDPIAASWVTRTTVDEQLAATWTTRTAVTEELAAAWATRARLTEQLAASYLMAGAVTEPLTATWVTRTAVADLLDASYVLRSQVSDQVASSWVTQAQVAETLAATWTVRAAVSEQLAASWATIGRLDELLAVSYAIDAAIGSVTEALAVSWTTRITLAELLAASWVTRRQVDEALQASWQTTGRVTEAVAAVWATRATITPLLAASWLTRTPVAEQLAVAWLTVGRITATLAAAYAISAPVGGPKPPRSGAVTFSGAVRATPSGPGAAVGGDAASVLVQAVSSGTRSRYPTGVTVEPSP